MKLKKIHFKSFKSLIDKKIKFEHNCIGIVGTNESGKSNILHAINALGGNRKLSIKDTPKMSKEKSPDLEFHLSLSTEDIEVLNNELHNWSKDKSISDNNFSIPSCDILFRIQYDKTKGDELYSFRFMNFKIKNDKILILKKEFSNDVSMIKTKDSFNPISKTVFITKKEIDYSENYYQAIFDDIIQIENDIKKLKDKRKPDIAQKVEIKGGKTHGLPVTKMQTPTKDSFLLNKLIEKKKDLEKQLEFNKYLAKEELIKKIESNNKSISNYKTRISQYNTNIKNLENKGLTIPTNKRAHTLAKNNLVKTTKALKESELSLKAKEKQLKFIDIPVTEKYTSDLLEINNYISDLLLPIIQDLLPKVVFWKYSDEYIIKSETQFNDLLSKKSLLDIPRPLLNIFRIGLKIESLEELKEWINEIRNDSNERSRKEKTINIRVNKYIKSVWTDYDQELKITLEKEQIRIEIFDPSYDDASYYNMEDRSQGAQTFISFLLTIGAEAKQGVIRNNILLLDEPETHLHPSGVRFMLKELLKISENDNIVIYATHSIFMIDRDKFDRHFILNKNQERTNIKPAKINRIGFFMQEEVLYKTLDIDLRSDFTSLNTNNFVFEGYGDSVLFEKFYSIITKRPFKLESTSFYQGGKCSDIQKYFSQNPIQLGSKWVFVIDKDASANRLKKFLLGKYNDYINKDIFIYQFEKNSETSDIKNRDVELEDLLPSDLIYNTYIKTIKHFLLKTDSEEVKKILKENELYEDYNSRIIEKIEFNKEEFKGKFKEFLNKEIANEISTCDNENKFKEKFPDFYNWSKAKLNEIIKKKQ